MLLKIYSKGGNTGEVIVRVVVLVMALMRNNAV